MAGSELVAGFAGSLMLEVSGTTRPTNVSGTPSVTTRAPKLPSASTAPAAEHKHPCPTRVLGGCRVPSRACRRYIGPVSSVLLAALISGLLFAALPASASAQERLRRLHDEALIDLTRLTSKLPHPCPRA